MNLLKIKKNYFLFNNYYNYYIIYILSFFIYYYEMKKLHDILHIIISIFIYLVAT